MFQFELPSAKIQFQGQDSRRDGGHEWTVVLYYFYTILDKFVLELTTEAES